MKYVVDELFRFRMLMAGVYLGLGISSNYGFSIFTEFLRSRYNFDQSDITTISTVGNCLFFLSFFGGMLFDYAGPRVLCPIAACLGFLGYLLFGLSFSGVIPPSESKFVNVVLLSLYNGMIYLACPAMDVSTVMPLMLNFPLERGYVVIIQKTFAGLGTSVLMAYFDGWFFDPENRDNSNFAGFAYFLGCHILLVVAIGMVLIELPPYYPSQYVRNRLTDEEKEEREGALRVIMAQPAPHRRLFIGVGLVLTVLVFLAVSSIVSAYVATTRKGYIAISVILVVILACFSIMALPFQFLGSYPVVEEKTKFRLIGIAQGEPDVKDVHRLARFMDVDAVDAGHADTLDDLETAGNILPPLGAQPDEPNWRESTKVSKDVDNRGEVQEVMRDVDPKVMVPGLHTLGETELMTQDGTEVEHTAVPQVPKISSVPDPQYEGNFWHHLATVDLWLLWFSFFGMWGTGAIMQSNAAQMYRSINNGNFDTARQSLYVALIGVGSAVGRIFSGLIDTKLTQWKAEGRTKILTTIFLPVGAGLMTLGYLFFAVLPAGALILPFIVTALGNGMAWGLGVLTMRILYAQDVGKHYSFMYSAGFVSTITLNRFMFGGMYDNEAKRLKTAPACNAPSCVRNQMFILMAVNALATVSAVVAHLRYARFVAKHRPDPLAEEEAQPLPISSSSVDEDDGVGSNDENRSL